MVLAVDAYKFWQYDDSYYDLYCVYDEIGDLVRVSDDAPQDFKEAFEEYKNDVRKAREDALKDGYLIG